MPATHALSPAGAFAAGAIGAAAIAPMIGTIVLGRELTPSEVWHIELSVVLGPVGWLVADQMFPAGRGAAPGHSSPHGHGRNHHINIPPGGIPFVPNEILVEADAGTSLRYIERLARRLHLTLLETQRFALSGRTLLRLRIDSARSAVSILHALARYARISAAQPNYLYQLQQGAPAVSRPVAADTMVQYVVGKLHLLEAHKITAGADVPVAMIDSKVDTTQPELAGAIAGEFDAVGGSAPPHPHGTAIAGAIAAHARLVGVAPDVKLLLARVFSGSGEVAQGTTFNLLKGIDWAASQGARVINMSFAGPSDPMIRNMLLRAHARGIVLVAAVGNGGPRSRPLYPAAYSDVIGVTATDVDDKVMPRANRGRQIAVGAPGVDIVAAAPDDAYQVTSGTSIAAAHVSGVAALLLAVDPKLRPDQVRRILRDSAHATGQPAREVGAGEIDALSALKVLKR